MVAKVIFLEIFMGNQVEEINNDEGFYRLHDVIGNRKSKPPIEGIFPIGRSTWYDGIASGIYPPPQKFGCMSMWPKRKIRDLLNGKKTW